MNNYGLIGKTVGKSYSKLAYKVLNGIDYSLFSFDNENDVKEFFNKKNFKGVNVTIPYKKVAKDCCDILTKEAIETDAVNLVINKENKLYGYNTDVYGFAYLLDKEDIDVKDKNCLILGTGATSRTVKFVLNNRCAKSVKFLSRAKRSSDTFSYDDLSEINNAQIIINTTPLQDVSLIDFKHIDNLEAFVDVVYKPLQTYNVISAQDAGIKAVGGLRMFVGQAVRSAELYFDKEHSLDAYDNLYKKVLENYGNIVLIGHPFSGKTTIGNELSKRINFKFIDVDSMIAKKEKKTISEIFEKKGEEYFRELELKTVKDIFSNKVGCVVSLGGGAILNSELMEIARKESVVISLKRDIDIIPSSLLTDRPLIKDREDLISIVKKRGKLYKKVANYIVQNNSTTDEVVERILKLL